MRGFCFGERPFGQKNRWQRFQPRPAGRGNRAVCGPEALAQGESSFATGHALGQSLVAVGDADLGEARVHIQENPLPRLVVFRSPDPKRHGPHYEQVGILAERPEFLQGRADGAVVGAIDPLPAKTEPLQAVADVSGRISEVKRPFFLVPIIDPGTIAAIFEVKNLVAKRSKAEQILQGCPGLAAESGTADRASEDDLHSPALSIKLPTTFSAVKYSAAISRAARQLPS